MTTIVRTIEVARDADAAWRVVGDLDRYDEMLVGITRWAPAGEGRYWVLMQVGSIATGGEVEVTVDDATRTVSWHTVRGQPHEARLEVRPDGADRCRLRLQVDYRVVGVLAPLATRAARPIVVRNLLATLETARHLVEHELGDPETP